MKIHRYGLISDTHGHLHRDVHAVFAGTEAILHAGDVVGADILDELQLIAPVHAVHGNCDWQAPGMPAQRLLDLPFGLAALTHGHLFGSGRELPEILFETFAPRSPRLIVFGHTHIQYLRKHGDIWVVNPGPAGKPRFRDKPSIMVANWNDETDEFTFDNRLLDWTAKR